MLIEVNPRAKTEIYLAKKVLFADPVFFGWPFLGQTKPKRQGNLPQPQLDPPPTAEVIAYGVTGEELARIEDESLKLWTYTLGRSANDDVRLTLVGGVHRLIPDGSVMVMAREADSRFDYRIELYPPGHSEHEHLLTECDQVLPGGRRFGWR